MEKFLLDNYWIVVALLVWTLPWKAVALWRSARQAQLGWFLTLTVFNTLGILEIVYIFFFSRKQIQPPTLVNVKNEGNGI